MLFKLSNGTQSQRYVWAHGHQTLVPPGETRTLDLTDNNAVFLKRCENRGDLFTIAALDDEGKEILTRANTPPVKGNYPNRCGPDAENPGEIVDGIEMARLKALEIKELAKLPDPGMRKAVPRVSRG